ncbi:MAG: 30S ribosomal protein S5 [Candidatus Aenigmarchaeota archaeon]|nr:30S ribosomal protein S5 [Candidatus Aenigmarchaeota archaeon]
MAEAPIEAKVEEIASAQIGSVIVPEVPAEIPSSPEPESLINWVPKTKLGRDVFEGRISSMDEVIESGKKVMEYQIIDKLVPGIKNELVLVGGRAGKGGGIQRIPVRITAAMHKSGRRFHTAALVVVGNEDGLVGMAQGRAVETREAIRKGIEQAKINVIKIRRGCGSWECGCGTPHSVPFKTIGKCGSVRVEILPAPKGVGIVAENEAKKLLKLAGLKDVWVKTFGNTSMRFNLISALFDALKKSYNYDRGNE